jgi:hypothetical protein
MLSCLFGLVDCNNKWKKTIDDISMVFIHEMCRATLDRVVAEADKTASFTKLLEIVKKNFGFEPSKKKHKVDATTPFYSYLKLDMTEFYNRMVGDCRKEFQTLKDTLDLYNQINYRTPIHVTLFNFILENIVKTNRSLK